MKKAFLLFIVVICTTVLLHEYSYAKQKSYKLTEYQPLTQSQCMEHKDSLGLKYCPHDNDHLAGAALACGHINNLPSMQDLQILATQIYNKRTSETTIYGTRNDKMLKEMGIFLNDSHIYYWIGEESKDGKGGYVRMFASAGSIPYYAPRDGSGYVSHQLGKINYGDTKYIRTKNPEHDSNLAGLPNNDVLVTICHADSIKNSGATNNTVSNKSTNKNNTTKNHSTTIINTTKYNNNKERRKIWGVVNSID